MTSGAVTGYVLKATDSNGNAAWQPDNTGGGGGLGGSGTTGYLPMFTGPGTVGDSPVNVFDGSGINVAGGIVGQTSTGSSSAIQGAAHGSVANFGVYGVRDGSGSGGAGVLGRATTAGNYGVFGQMDGSSGTASGGLATAAAGNTFGVHGQSNSTTGIGVKGYVPASSGDTYGVSGQAKSDSGTGVLGFATASSGDTYGVFGVADSNSGIGVAGLNRSTSGFTYGAYGQSDSNVGVGVRGWASDPGSYYSPPAPGTVPSLGVYGRADSMNGAIGVFGMVHAEDIYFEPGAQVSGSWGVAGKNVQAIDEFVANYASGGVLGDGVTADVFTYSSGVLGVTNSIVATAAGVLGRNLGHNQFGEGTGVRGEGRLGVVGMATSSSAGSWGILSLGASGTAGQKSFLQPHPTDPSRQIVFCSLEGNESGTYFRGKVILRGGMAAVDVPEEFRLASEPDDLTVQLTKTSPGDVWLVRYDLEQIVIAGDADVEVHYLVNGVRRGFRSHEAIQENTVFVPHVRGEPFGEEFPAGMRAILVENGTLNADYTPNETTAAAHGWRLGSGRGRRISASLLGTEPNPREAARAERQADGRPGLKSAVQGERKGIQPFTSLGNLEKPAGDGDR